MSRSYRSSSSTRPSDGPRGDGPSARRGPTPAQPPPQPLEVPVEPRLAMVLASRASTLPYGRVLAQAVSAPRFVGKRAVESFSPFSFKHSGVTLALWASMPTYTRSPPPRRWSGRSVRAEPDKLLFESEPQDSGSMASKLAVGSKPHCVDARHPRAPPFIPREGRALFLADQRWRLIKTTAGFRPDGGAEVPTGRPTWTAIWRHLRPWARNRRIFSTFSLVARSGRPGHVARRHEAEMGEAARVERMTTGREAAGEIPRVISDPHYTTQRFHPDEKPERVRGPRARAIQSPILG